MNKEEDKQNFQMLNSFHFCFFVDYHVKSMFGLLEHLNYFTDEYIFPCLISAC